MTAKRRQVRRREYQHHRFGAPITLRATMPECFERPRTAWIPLHERFIAGVDTEQHAPDARRKDTVLTSVVTVSFVDELLAIDLRKKVVVTHDPTTKKATSTTPLPTLTAAEELQGAEALLSVLMSRPEWSIASKGAASDTAQRKKLSSADRKRRRSRTGRDGRRVSVPVRVITFHNLPFDVTRLFGERETLRRMHAGAPSFRRWVGERYEIEWVRYRDRGAAQLEWFVRSFPEGERAKAAAENRKPKEERIARIRGVDTVAYLKTTLKKAAKDFLAPENQKLDTDKSFFERDLTSFSDEEWEEFRRYAAADAAIPRLLYLAVARLIRDLGSEVTGREGLLPCSLPAIAAKQAFAKAWEMHPDITKWRRPPAEIDAYGTLAYHGARVFCTLPGVWRDLVSLDKKSAYPTVVAQVPDPVTARYRKVQPSAPGTVWNPKHVLEVAREGFNVEEWRGRWGILYVDGESLDALYPAICARGGDGTLRWHVGPFRGVPVSIPELVIGVVRGALRIDKIRSGCVIEGEAASSFLRAFVLETYAVREEAKREKNIARAALAKLLLNSLYGKFVEVVAGVSAWAVHEAIEEPLMSDGQMSKVAKSVIHILANDGNVEPDDLWFGYADAPKARAKAEKARALYADQRISPTAGDDADEYALNDTRRYLDSLAAAYGSRASTIGSLLRRGRTFTPGPFFMPVYAAQITGLTAAVLGSMAAATCALAGDTDAVSVVCPTGRLEDIEGIEQHYAAVREAGYAAPVAGGKRDGVDTIAGTTLGQWEVEMSPSVESIIVARKRYSHAYRAVDEETGKLVTRYKQARHGVSNVASADDDEVLKAHTTAEAMGVGAGLHALLKRLLRDGTATYKTRPSPRKGREAVATGKTVGVFRSKTIVAKNDPNPYTIAGADGRVRWRRALLVYETVRGMQLPRFIEVETEERAAS